MPSPLILKNDRTATAKTDTVLVDTLGEYTAGNGVVVNSKVALGVATDPAGARLQVGGAESTAIDIQPDGGLSRSIRLRSGSAGSGESLYLKAATSMASDLTVTFPVDQPTVGQVLTSDASGNLEWSTPAASGDSALLQQQVAQVAHGFTLTNGIPIPVYWNAGAGEWQVADQLPETDVKQAFIVSVDDVDTFTLQLNGYHNLGGGHGLIDGEYYWLSGSAPYYTNVQPTSGTMQLLWAVEGDRLRLFDHTTFDIDGTVGGSGDGGGFHRRTVDQPMHGFVLTNMIPVPVYWDAAGQQWVPADLSPANQVKQAFVVNVIDVDSFEIQISGFHTLDPGHGLTDGEYYWLDASPPHYTAVQPESGTVQLLWAVEGDRLRLFDHAPYTITVLTGLESEHKRDINQPAHGFSLTNQIPIPVFYDGGSSAWVAADQTPEEEVKQAFIVDIIDNDNFTIQSSGSHLLSPGHGLTDGEYYWLTSAPPYYTDTQPATGVVQQLWLVEGDRLWLADHGTFDLSTITPETIGAATARVSFGEDITTGTTATDTLSHDTFYNLDASGGTITLTLNSGTAGDEISFRVADLTNSITISAGTATPTYYGKTVINTVEDRVVMFWRTTSDVDIHITGTA